MKGRAHTRPAQGISTKSIKLSQRKPLVLTKCERELRVPDRDKSHGPESFGPSVARWCHLTPPGSDRKAQRPGPASRARCDWQPGYSNGHGSARGGSSENACRHSGPQRAAPSRSSACQESESRPVARGVLVPKHGHETGKQRRGGEERNHKAACEIDEGDIFSVASPLNFPTLFNVSSV